ncbi:unnamed protein product [Cuscuta campestris]|uniref:Retrotransposon Copia-like N-terminal domain-containing protein n=1 Tax=Cuscuta campestris TaxID=132261 RepID=A0A484NIH9_9ASTE|nr:unnamed protein product [Cuscuta campestris]
MKQPVNLAQILEILENFQNLAPKADPIESSSNQPLNLAEKLNDKNYAIWARKMSLALDGRGRLKHITAAPLKNDDSTYIKWRQADSTVITWILENIESDIVNQYIDYPTAWDLWKGIKATYGSGKDPFQIYDLMVKASEIKQGAQPLEKIYSQLQAVWKEIDRCRPNPMKCPEDMTIFTQIQQQNRLYQFLQAVNEEFDAGKRDLLKTEPLPSVEEAYAQIRREAARKGIMKGEGGGPSSGETPSGIGGGLVATRVAVRSENRQSSSRTYEEKSHLKCTYCGGIKHTAEGCFKRIGYPEWWPDSPKRGKKPSGVVGAAVGNPETTSTAADHIFAGVTTGKQETQSSVVCELMKQAAQRKEKERGERATNDSLEWLHSPFLPPSPALPLEIETVPTKEVSRSVGSSFDNNEESNNSEPMSDSTPPEAPEVIFVVLALIR